MTDQQSQDVSLAKTNQQPDQRNTPITPQTSQGILVAPDSVDKQDSPANVPPVSPSSTKSYTNWLIIGTALFAILLLIGGITVINLFRAPVQEVKRGADRIEKPTTAPQDALDAEFDRAVADLENAVTDIGLDEIDNPDPSLENDTNLMYLESDLGIDQLPTAPQGFAWYNCANLSGYFLQPKGWYTLEESENGGQTKACFITQEKIVGNGLYQTGLSVNLVKNVEAASGKSVDEYAQEFLNLLLVQHTGEPVTKKNLGNYTSYTTAIEIDDENGHIMNHYALLTFADTGFLYFIMFESPYNRWQAEWEQFGKPIMEQLVVVQ